jgi:tetratricopeptide (TPR) repeat protein
MRRFGAVCAVAGFLARTGAWAGDSPSPPQASAHRLPEFFAQTTLSNGAPQPGGGNSRQTTGDAGDDAVVSALRDVQAHGILSVATHEAKLRQVIDNMPHPFERVRAKGDKVDYIADSLKDCTAFAASKARAGGRTITCHPNPYPGAGLLLGSYYDETGRFADALEMLDAAGAAAPNVPALISERNAALIGLHRWADVLMNAETGLALRGLSDRDKARLYRNKGYALTELQRLDEAKQAYEDSLQLDPDNPLAVHELAYIDGLRTGKQPAAGGQLISVQPKRP